jgi:3-deoxy-D-manno-octulosonate 8-phosphate phosphatase (KDO 8-P phosphatase)
MARLTSAEFHERARALRLLLFDVDGVLTDGIINVDGTGGESKAFYIRDGASIVWAHRAGLETGVVSGRRSKATAVRATELGMAVISQGFADKRLALTEILTSRQLKPTEVAFMGDDLIDLPALRLAGLSAAPADAAPEVQAAVHWVGTLNGGRGAVREFMEAVLKARGEWDDVLATYA